MIRTNHTMELEYDGLTVKLEQDNSRILFRCHHMGLDSDDRMQTVTTSVKLQFLEDLITEMQAFVAAVKRQEARD